VPTFHSLSPPARLSLAGRLDRLRHALDVVGGELAEGVADAAAQAVSGAVRDAVLALLTAGRNHTPLLQRDRFGSPPDLRPSLWSGLDQSDQPDEPEDAPWDDREEGPWPGSPGDRHIPATPTPAPAAQPRVRRWASALAAGWRAGLWWLRRRPGRSTLLTALGVGLAAGLGAFLVASLVPAGVGLLGSALDLAALADVARSGAAALATLAP
jgi:hypothetical protein